MFNTHYGGFLKLSLTGATENTRMILGPEERIFKHLHDPSVNTGFLAFAGAGHIEAFDVLFRDELLQAKGRIIEESALGCYVDTWLPVLPSKFNGPEGSTCHFGGECENHRSIRISDVPFRPLEV
jgi:hypothetical protein